MLKFRDYVDFEALNLCVGFYFDTKIFNIDKYFFRV